MAAIPGIMVDIGANVARMQADMRKLTGTMESGFGQIRSAAMKLGGVLAGAFTFGAIIRFGEEALKAGDRMAKLSQSTGVSVETLSALKYAADLANVDLDSLAKGMGILSRNMLDAQSGSGEAKDAIKALGISVIDTKGNLLSSDKVMGQVADKLAGMKDGAAKTALAMKIFGRSGAEMIPLLNQGSSALAEMREEAEKLGLIMSEETAQQMERVNDNFTRLKSVAQGAAIRLMSELVPTLENLTNIFFDLTKNSKDFNEAAQVVATGFRLMASSGVIVYAVLKTIGDRFGALAAAIYSAVQGDIIMAFEIMEMNSRDIEATWSKTGKTLEKIWDTSAEAALRGANRMKKGMGEGPRIAGDVDKLTEAIEKQLNVLFEQAEAMQMGEDALDLYRKGLHNATEEQKAYALELIKTIQAFENKEAARKLIENLELQALTFGTTARQAAIYTMEFKRMPADLIKWADSIWASIEAMQAQEDQLKQAKEIIESTRSPLEKHVEYMDKLQKLHEAGAISVKTYYRAANTSLKALTEGDEKAMADRERILLDFADRFRAVTLDSADYAIGQIERQTQIFRQAGADEVAVAIWAAKEKQKASQEWQDGAIRAFQNYAAEAGNMAKNVESAINGAFKNMEDVLVDFVKTGKMDFKNLVDSIIADLMRIAIRKFITAPLSSGLGSLVASLFSGGGGGSAGAGATTYDWGFQHGGGVAGISSGMSMRLPAAYVAAAPRYHGGLQPDEFPAVLKRGEGVFTPEQMQAMGGRTNISITIPVTVGAMDVRQAGRMRRDLEGELEPVVRKIVERYV
jgi:lambda family phage tail tape measure protein